MNKEDYATNKDLEKVFHQLLNTESEKVTLNREFALDLVQLALERNILKKYYIHLLNDMQKSIQESGGCMLVMSQDALDNMRNKIKDM